MFGAVGIFEKFNQLKADVKSFGAKVQPFALEAYTVLQPVALAIYADATARNLITAAQVAQAEALWAKACALYKELAPVIADVEKLG